MTSPFLGQIIQGGWNFNPRGYLFCQGQLIAISQNTALFALLGTTFGGNGQTTFALPDLRGRSMMGTGTGPGLSPVVLGELGGVENVTLTTNQMPSHTHLGTFNGSSSTLSTTTVRATTQTAAAGSLLARTTDNAGTAIPLIYAPAGSAPAANLGGLNIAGTVTIGTAGNSQPATNRSPYLGITHVIAVQGIFPSRN